MKVPVLVGTSAASTSINGVKPSEREERRHYFLSRVSSTVDTTMLNDYCKEKNLTLLGCRELPSKRADMKSFHVVIPVNERIVAEKAETWPENIIVCRYFLNEEARTWLKSLNLQSETSIHVCALWNARSICNKTDSIYSYLLANDVNFLAITETWLSEDSLFYVNLAKPCNYNYIGNNRPTRVGGSGIFYLNTFRIKLIEESICNIWEFLVAEFTLTDMNVCIFVLYRCPNSSCSIFLNELVDLVTHYALQYKWCYINGDFNIPVNKSCNSSEALLSSMEEMGFYRYSSGPTHVGGNELDLIFFNHRVTNFVALDRTLASDHYCVTLIINSSAVTIAPSNVNLKAKWL